jgi:hypothetical protein
MGSYSISVQVRGSILGVPGRWAPATVELTVGIMTWTAQVAPLPAGAPADVNVSMDSVTCPGGHCIAIGSCATESGTGQPMILTGPGSSWKAVRAPLPAGAATAGFIRFTSPLACSAGAYCTAAGLYETKARVTQAFLLTESGSAWTATEASEPGNAASGNGHFELSALACPSVTRCVAVGTYQGDLNYEYGWILDGSGTHWSLRRPRDIKRPDAAALRNDAVLAVVAGACPHHIIDRCGRQIAGPSPSSAGRWTCTADILTIRYTGQNEF